MDATPLIPAGYDVLWTFLVFAVLAVAIWALVSLARSDLDPVTTLVWAIVILAAPILGSCAWIIWNSTRGAAPIRRGGTD